MFWKNQYKYEILDKKVDNYKIKKTLNEYGIILDLDNPAGEWAGFGFTYGLENGMSQLEATSFSSMVALFMSGMAASAGTDYYFNEEKIEKKIYSRYVELQEDDLSEEDKVKKLFEYITELYLNEIKKYEVKTEQVRVRLSKSDYDLFLDVPGDNKADKFQTLLKYYYKKNR